MTSKQAFVKQKFGKIKIKQKFAKQMFCKVKVLYKTDVHNKGIVNYSTKKLTIWQKYIVLQVFYKKLKRREVIKWTN